MDAYPFDAVFTRQSSARKKEKLGENWKIVKI